MCIDKLDSKIMSDYFLKVAFNTTSLLYIRRQLRGKFNALRIDWLKYNKTTPIKCKFKYTTL